MNLSAIVTCPNCKMQVLPKVDGTCPSCQFVFPQNKELPSKKVDHVKSNKTTNRVANESKTSPGQPPIKPNSETKKNKEIMAINEKHMSKEEYKEKYRQQRIHHDSNMPRPNPIPVDQGKAPSTSHDENKENLEAFAIGAPLFLVGIIFFVQEYYPTLMHTQIPKIIYIVILIIGGVLGIAVRNLIIKIFEEK
jgi:hypothetical protein